MSTTWKIEIVTDFNRLNSGEISLPEFINIHWEKFIPIYVKTTKTSDYADLIIVLNNFFSKILKMDVQPLFQSDNQIFNYFKTSLRNSILEKDYYKPKIVEVSIDKLEEDYEGFEFASEETIDSNLLDRIQLEEILDELAKRLSERQMKAIILLYKKDYSRKEASKELGIPFWTFNDMIYRSKDIVMDVIKMFKK